MARTRVQYACLACQTGAKTKTSSHVCGSPLFWTVPKSSNTRFCDFPVGRITWQKAVVGIGKYEGRICVRIYNAACYMWRNYFQTTTNPRASYRPTPGKTVVLLVLWEHTHRRQQGVDNGEGSTATHKKFERAIRWKLVKIKLFSKQIY